MERRIVIGLITDTNYLRQLKDSWNPEYIESDAARTLCRWCWEYYDKYDKAPNKNIQHIFDKKVRKKKINKTLAEEIETEILPDLSEQHKKQKEDESLLKETWEYFVERQFQIYNETTETFLEKGELEKAKEYHNNFVLFEGNESEGLDLSSPEVNDKLDEAFVESKPILKMPGTFGEFINDELVVGSFVSFLAPEKRGKTWTLVGLLRECIEQDVPVALFQAGDMTENQQLMRIAINLAQKSNKAKFCGKQYIPVLDCIKNQTDTCNKKIRACKFGIFEPERAEKLRDTITREELIEANQNNKFYKNCYNCLAWQRNKWGTVWLKEYDNGKDPLTANEAKRLYKKYFKNNNLVKLSTHANGELSIPKMKSILENWRIKENFKPKVVLLDYADLVESLKRLDMRHQIDFVWRSLRGMSQKYNFLLAAPTQADAKSYEQELLKLGNFSEDKRKLAHVMAMWGLNQSPDGREKALGIMRYNKIVIREDGFHSTDQVRVLQHLPIGQPFLGSFW